MAGCGHHAASFRVAGRLHCLRPLRLHLLFRAHRAPVRTGTPGPPALTWRSACYTGRRHRRRATMAKRMTCSCLGFAAMIATAAAQPAAETWMPASRTAQMLTGRVTFTPTELTFQNGKSLPLAGNGQMLFRPEPKAKKVLADLYKVTSPESMTLEGGNSL